MKLASEFGDFFLEEGVLQWSTVMPWHRQLVLCDAEFYK